MKSILRIGERQREHSHTGLSVTGCVFLVFLIVCAQGCGRAPQPSAEQAAAPQAVGPQGAAAQETRPQLVAPRLLTVIRPGDPQFDSLLKANYPGIENLEEYQLVRPFIVLLRNDTPVAANAYLVEWEVQTADGKTHDLESSYFQKDYLGRDANTTLAPGKVCLMSPFLWQPPEPQSAGSVVHRFTPTLADVYSGPQTRSVKSQLDSVIFDDGSHGGPDKNQLLGQYACVRLAERDEREVFRRMLQANGSEEEIKARFDRDIAPLRNPALYDSAQAIALGTPREFRLEDFCTLERGYVAQSLKASFSYRGAPSLRTTLGLDPAPIASSQVSFLMPGKFSADIIWAPAEVPPNGQRVSVKRGELHMTRERIRVDLESQPTRMIDLVDVPGKRFWLLYPRGNWAKDESPRADWDALGLPGLFPFNLGVARPFDPEQPCFGLEGGTCRDLGTDTVDGRACEKWALQTARRPGQTERQLSLCIDSRLRIPLRASNYELHNVREGAQEASLFEVPQDFHKVFADGREEGPPALPFNVQEWQAGLIGQYGAPKIGEIGLSEAEISAIVRLLGSDRDNQELFGATRESVDAEFVASRVDMGEGPQNGLALMATHAFCGVSGGCQAWLFRKVGATWASVGGTLADFKLVPPKHNGLFELMTVGHVSAGAGLLNVSWFDGTRYSSHATYCVIDDHLEAGPCQ